MADSALPKVSDFVSPDYRAKCLEWAIQIHSRDHKTAEKIVEDAETFYKYVYGKRA